MQDRSVWGHAPDLSIHGEEIEGAGLRMGRVAEVQKGAYRIVGDGEESFVPVSGKFEFTADGPADFPAVGDWVLMRGEGDGRIIERVLPRHSRISRKAVGAGSREQLIAANVDLALLTTSMSKDFNPRRLERYLAVVRAGSALPVIVLTKADACEDPEAFVTQAREISGGARIFPVSAISGTGIAELEAELTPGLTVALIGSSGVGKSTLLNHLMGEEVMATQDVRTADDKGRHTTTSRCLFRLPGGALVIDTPGMRELGLWDADEGVEESFEDIQVLSAACRYRDCAHDGEPDCAVEAAILAGRLDPARLASFRKLKREHAYERIRGDKAAMSRQKKRWKALTKRMRKSDR